MDQQTHITSVIYATRRGLHTNGLIMKVQNHFTIKKNDKWKWCTDGQWHVVFNEDDY